MPKTYLPALLWLFIVTGLSVTPGVSLPKFDLFSPDKLGHVAAYGILAGLIFCGRARSETRQPNWKEGFIIFLLSTGYGILMEFVQGAFIPGRFFEIEDMIANAVGAALAWSTATFFTKRTV